MTAPVALTIAGFDPTGGAGILADAATFISFGLQPVGVTTSVTFQSAIKFFGATHQTAETVRAQLEPLLQNSTIVCAKTGMLPTREIVLEVARLFRESALPRPVVDPVMISSTGFRLMAEEALAVFMANLVPEAALVTPNVPEAETLSGITITSEADMRQAAAIIRDKGASAVLIKGGHLQQKAVPRQATGEAIDVLDNQGRVTVFRERRIPDANLHGSGCILSAAIAAGLGKGMTLEDSVAGAKRFVLEKLAQAKS